MIDNIEARPGIARALGSGLDELVRERMNGLVEEPAITSRVGYQLEERFDGKDLYDLDDRAKITARSRLPMQRLRHDAHNGA